MCRRLAFVAMVVFLALLEGCAGGFPGRNGSNSYEPTGELTPQSTAD